MRLTAILTGLLLATVAVAQVQPVATMSFDRDFSAKTASGSVAATPEGKPELALGKVGQALKCGPKLGQLRYPTQGLLSRSAGTVEMWVCPVDWSSDDQKFHVFFETRNKGALYLYEYFSTDRLLMLTCPELEGPYVSAQVDTAFKPGVWHHIAGTWSASGVMVYLDGKPAHEAPLPGELPRELGETFLIGDEQWQFPRESSSLVDEVRVYDRALTPRHIAAHAAGDYNFSLPLTAAAVRLGYEVDPDAYTVRARFDSGGADAEDARVRVAMSLVPKGQAPLSGAAAGTLQAGIRTQLLPFPSREAGDYDLVAVVQAEGQAQFETRQTITIPKTDWLGNGLGQEDKVLPPWTPLRVSGTDLSVWGRRYGFRQAMLPTRISTAGAEVLARPVALKLTANGKPVAWRDQQVRLKSASDTRAELEGAAVASVGGVTARFQTRIKAEYDGLVLFETTCAEAEKLPAEGLTLEIPVKAENAIYRHRYASSWIPTSGNVPAGQGVVEKMPWVPFVWFGDNDRGLFWFTEDDRAWADGRSENAIEIVRQGQEIMLRLNLLQKGQKLPAGWSFQWGLQATPVKPIPKDWRKWRMTGAYAGDKVRSRQNVDIIWPEATHKDSLEAFGWPAARDPQLFAERMKRLSDKGLLTVPYLCLTYVREDTPEWQFFKRIWAMGSVDPSIPEAGWKHTFAMVSPNGRGYQDFIMARTKQFLEQYGIAGTYHDQTHPYMSTSTRAGVGYERDGKAHHGTPILGYRELYRHNYAIVKSLGRPTFTQAHMSGKMTIPVLAYEDSYLDGEHFRGEVKDSYLDVMTLDSFRCEYMGRQWGLMPFFLPEFGAAERQQVEPTRGLMGLLLIHDVSLWPIWCNAQVVDEALSAMDEFGWIDSEFVPYFDKRPPARTALRDVHVSGYQRADGRVLLVVANLGRTAQTGSVQVDLGRLGFTAAKAVSWPDRAPLAMDQGKLELTVPGLGYRLVALSR